MRKTLGRRLFLGGAGAAAATSLLASCGSSGQGTTSGGGPSYGTPGGVVEDKAWEPVFKTYNQDHPKHPAKYVAVGGNYTTKYLEKLQTLIAGNRAPDIFWLQAPYLASWAEKGYISPIDDLVKNSSVDLGQYWKPSIDALTYNGKLYGLPRDGAPYVLWYNADMFDKANIDYPTEKWTWEDYLKAGQALTQRDSSGRAKQIGADRGDWISWVWQAGGKLLNESKDKCLLDQPPAVKAFQFMQDLVVKYHVAPSPKDLGNASTSAAGQAIQDKFNSGQLGMYIAVRGSLGAMCSTKLRFAAAPLPADERRVARALCGPTLMLAKSKDKDEAFELMKYICSAKGQKLKISSGYAYPSVKAAVEQSWYKDFRCGNSLDTSINTACTTEYKNGWTQAVPPVTTWPQIENEVTKALDELFLGSTSAKELCLKLTKSIDAILQGK